MSLACGICLGKLGLVPEREGGYEHQKEGTFVGLPKWDISRVSSEDEITAQYSRLESDSDEGDNASYLVTPCGHLFHSECLKEWIWIKMEPEERQHPRITLGPLNSHLCAYCRQTFKWPSLTRCFPALLTLEEFQSSEGTQTLEIRPKVKDGACQTESHPAIKSISTQTHLEVIEIGIQTISNANFDAICQTSPEIMDQACQISLELDSEANLGAQDLEDPESNILEVTLRKMQVRVDKCINILDSLDAPDISKVQINENLAPSDDESTPNEASSTFFDGSYFILLLIIILFLMGMTFEPSRDPNAIISDHHPTPASILFDKLIECLSTLREIIDFLFTHLKDCSTN